MKGSEGENTNQRSDVFTEEQRMVQGHHKSQKSSSLGEQPHARDCRAEATYTISGLGESL